MFPVVWVRVWVLKLGTRVLRVRVPSTQAPTLPGIHHLVPQDSDCMLCPVRQLHLYIYDTKHVRRGRTRLFSTLESKHRDIVQSHIEMDHRGGQDCLFVLTIKSSLRRSQHASYELWLLRGPIHRISPWRMCFLQRSGGCLGCSSAVTCETLPLLLVKWALWDLWLCLSMCVVAYPSSLPTSNLIQL